MLADFLLYSVLAVWPRPEEYREVSDQQEIVEQIATTAFFEIPRAQTCARPKRHSEGQRHTSNRNKLNTNETLPLSREDEKRDDTN